jgi:RHS repeat-associated protein
MFYYDHTGSRMLAIHSTGGVKFWFAESETHYNLSGEQTRRYVHFTDGSTILGRVENRTAVELHYADANRNLLLAMDENGDIEASFLYGPFGEVVHEQGSIDHRRRFNGKEQDRSGLLYYGARYYDPSSLRWISGDRLYTFAPDRGLSEPQLQNLYTFSLNNSLKYFDPDGSEPKSTFWKNAWNKAKKTLEGWIRSKGRDPNRPGHDAVRDANRDRAYERQRPYEARPRPTPPPVEETRPDLPTKPSQGSGKGPGTGQAGSATLQGVAVGTVGTLIVALVAPIVQGGLGWDLEAREQGPFVMTPEQKAALKKQRQDEKYNRFVGWVANEMGMSEEDARKFLEEGARKSPPQPTIGLPPPNGVKVPEKY